LGLTEVRLLISQLLKEILVDVSGLVGLRGGGGVWNGLRGISLFWRDTNGI